MLDFGLGKGEEAENSSFRRPKRAHYPDVRRTCFADHPAICNTPIWVRPLPFAEPGPGANHRWPSQEGYVSVRIYSVV